MRHNRLSTILRADGAASLDLRFTEAALEPIVFTAAGAADGSPKLPTFSGTAYNGGIMYPSGFYGSAVVVDLAGVKVPSGAKPILLEHEPSDRMGHTTEVNVAGKIIVKGILSGTGDNCEKARMDAANGFPFGLSIGGMMDQPQYIPEGESIQANGKTFKGPLYFVKKFTLKEISFVALAADDRTSVRIAAKAAGAQKGVIPMTFEQWLAAKGFNPQLLTDEGKATLEAAWNAEMKPASLQEGNAPATPAAPATPLQASAGGNGAGNVPADPVADYRSRMAAEAERVEKVLKACGEFPTLHAQAIREGWDLARAEHEAKREQELQTLRASRGGASGVRIPGDHGSTEPKVLECALCLSGGIPQAFLANHFDQATLNAALEPQNRDVTLHVLMDRVLHAAGEHFAGSRKSNGFIKAALNAERRMMLQADGFSTISLSGILSNVANKAMLAAFQAVGAVYPKITAERSHSDFKPNYRYRLDATGAFQEVGPDGELKHIGLTDAEYSNTLATHGAIIALNRQMMINDDLGAFLQIPTILGRMSVIKIEETVFKLILANAGSFFAASNGNYTEGAATALSITSLQALEQLFLDMVDVNGKPILIQPKVLLVPSTLKVLADQLYRETTVMVSTTTDKAKFAANPYAGKYEPVSSTYLNNTAIRDAAGKALSGQSDTAHYLFANPADRAAIGVAFLNGKTVPTIESSEAEFDVLGMQWRAYHDFGVAWEETVAAVMSKGAA